MPLSEEAVRRFGAYDSIGTLVRSATALHNKSANTTSIQQNICDKC